MSIQLRILNNLECQTIEYLIRNKNPSLEPCVSVRDKMNEINSYMRMKLAPIYSYSIYSTSGFRSYAHYKSHDETIYTIEIYLQEPECYSITNTNKLLI